MTIADHQEEDERAGPMRLSVAGQTNGPAREIKAVTKARGAERKWLAWQSSLNGNSLS